MTLRWPAGVAGGNWAMRAALIAYGILNAVLYAALLPLWEGFDEPFHYAYVQELSERHNLPRLGKAPLSAEVWASLQLAPASGAVKHNLPQVTTFEDYFRLPRARRDRMRAQLDHLPRGYAGSAGLNYEAQQAPLAYLPLAAADRAWSSSSLPTRVWRLRLVCGVFASATTAGFLFLLAWRLHLPRRFEGPLVFTVLSSQMFYATVAHVSNDALAVPLMIALFERLAAILEDPTTKNALLLTLALVAGLLTKVYFLALVPVVVGVFVALAVKRALSWRGIGLFIGLALAGAGPWYVRNLLVYRNLSGMQETNGRTDWRGLATAFTRVPWLRSIREMLFRSLWTGNNSFWRFSSTTLSMLLGGFAAAGMAYAYGCAARRKPPAPELVVLCGCAMYGLSLLYAATVAFWYSNGAASTAGPWYAQSLMALLASVLFCGLARSGAAGRIISSWLVCCSAYIISATYWAKLIPLYSGYSEGRTTLVRLLAWYRANFGALLAEPSAAAMAGPKPIFVLAAAVAAAAIAFSIILLRRQFQPDDSLSRDD